MPPLEPEFSEPKSSEPKFSDHNAIDDCWNRIGIRGDQSCPKLVRYVHCRNCDVYARGAADLLDRISITHNTSQDTSQGSSLLPEGSLADTSKSLVKSARSGRREGEPVLVFRVASEWFALSARFVHQVGDTGPVHSLPKLRSKAVMGLANVRGQLTVCVSLSRLLDLNESEGAPAGSDKPTRSAARFLVIRDVGAERGREPVREGRGDDMTVFPVDEVHGIIRPERDMYRAVPATLAHAAAFHTRSMIDWDGHAVGVLDSALLFETLRRSLG